MKGGSSGRPRPSTPSRRSSLSGNSTTSARKIVFKDLDDAVNPPTNISNYPSNYMQRRSTIPSMHKSLISGDKSSLNVNAPRSSTLDSSADLVRRTKGDATDSGHPFGVQRRFSAPAAGGRACSYNSSSLLPSNKSSVDSKSLSCCNCLISDEISAPKKPVLSPNYYTDYCRYNDPLGDDNCIISGPSSSSSSSDRFPSSSDLIESRLHRMSLRSDATKQASLIDHNYSNIIGETVTAANNEEKYTIGGSDVKLGHTSNYVANAPKTVLMLMKPPKGLSCLVGLYNEGNTCYLNSCIQCLAHTMPLASAMLGDKLSIACKEKLSRACTSTSAGGGGAFMARKRGSSTQKWERKYEADWLAMEFQELVRAMWSSRPPYSVASASSFLRWLQEWDIQFSGYQQQDAQEAMRAILDGLHESLNRVDKRRYVDIYREYESRPEDELAQITWDYHKSLNDSVIQDIFCGQLQSTIECSVCRRTSHCFDPFLDLSLPLPEHGFLLGGKFKSSSKWRVAIQDCLALFVAPEMLSGNDRYKCATCKVPQTSTKKLSIYRAPAILVLHLKRFHGSGPFSYKKDDTPVCYPLKGLDLTELLGKTPQREHPHGLLYDLYAVCHHSGSIGCGHYTAQCKNIDGLWYSFNDSSVTPADESTVVSSSAYILFYQLRLE